MFLDSVNSKAPILNCPPCCSHQLHRTMLPVRATGLESLFLVNKYYIIKKWNFLLLNTNSKFVSLADKSILGINTRAPRWLPATMLASKTMYGISMSSSQVHQYLSLCHRQSISWPDLLDVFTESLEDEFWYHL